MTPSARPLALVIGFGRQLARDLLDLRLGRAEVREAGGDDDPDDGPEAFDLLSLARPGLGQRRLAGALERGADVAHTGLGYADRLVAGPLDDQVERLVVGSNWSSSMSRVGDSADPHKKGPGW